MKCNNHQHTTNQKYNANNNTDKRLGLSFSIFCVVLKNTDCCLFKFIFSVAKGTNPTFFKKHVVSCTDGQKKKDA